MADLIRSAHGYPFREPPSKLAMDQMNLTPEEENLYQHHLNNLTPKRWIQQPDGSISTVLQRGEDGEDYGGVPGRTYNFPTVWNGKALSGDALRQAIQPMSQWPSYATDDEAENRYNEMHGAMEMDMQALQGGNK